MFSKDMLIKNFLAVSFIMANLATDRSVILMPMTRLRMTSQLLARMAFVIAEVTLLVIFRDVRGFHVLF